MDDADAMKQRATAAPAHSRVNTGEEGIRLHDLVRLRPLRHAKRQMMPVKIKTGITSTAWILSRVGFQPGEIWIIRHEFGPRTGQNANHVVRDRTAPSTGQVGPRIFWTRDVDTIAPRVMGRITGHSKPE